MPTFRNSDVLKNASMSNYLVKIPAEHTNNTETEEIGMVSLD